MTCQRLYPNLPALTEKNLTLFASDQLQVLAVSSPGEKSNFGMPHLMAYRPQPVHVLPPPYAEVPPPPCTGAPPPYSTLDVVCATPRLGEASLLLEEHTYNKQSRTDESYTTCNEKQTSSTVNRSAYAHLPPTHELDTDECDGFSPLVLQRIQAYAY